MVKKYSTVIKRLAEEKFDDYMGGSMLPRYTGSRIVSFIYGVSEKKVHRDVEAAYKKKINSYYK